MENILPVSYTHLLYLSVFAAVAAGGAARQPAEPAGSFLAFVL